MDIKLFVVLRAVRGYIFVAVIIVLALLLGLYLIRLMREGAPGSQGKALWTSRTLMPVVLIAAWCAFAYQMANDFSSIGALAELQDEILKPAPFPTNLTDQEVEGYLMALTRIHRYSVSSVHAAVHALMFVVWILRPKPNSQS